MNTLMKIGQFSESFMPVVDGVARVVNAYADTMSKRGHEVYVITPMDNTGFRGRLPFEIVDFNSIPLSKTMPWKIGVDSFDSHFIQRMKNIDLDIVHVHSPASAGLSGCHIAKKRNIPLIGSFHSKYYDDVFNVTHSVVLAKTAAKFVADFYEKCDEVWTVSEGSVETLRKYGYRGKTIVIPNGTNIRVLNKTRIPEIRKEYSLPEGIPVFLFVGQIDWKKGLETTLKACSLFKKNGKDFRLVLAGKGPNEDGVKELADNLNLKNNLIMTGHLTDTEKLDCLYNIADLFVFPSVYDNAPMVVREAAAMNTPSVLIEGSCSAEIIKDRQNGILCKNTPEDLCEKIKWFIELDNDQKERINNCASETIPVKWDGPLMDNILERYQNLIEKYKADNN